MKVHKGYKFRLEPTEEQEVKINKTLGCCRFIYNSILDRRIKAYRRRGESMSYIDTQNLLPQMKTYLPWLAEADSQALKYSCRQLDNAYKGFFKDGKGFPQFKRKRGEESYTTTKAKSIKVDEAHDKYNVYFSVAKRKATKRFHSLGGLAIFLYCFIQITHPAFRSTSHPLHKAMHRTYESYTAFRYAPQRTQEYSWLQCDK